MPRINLTVRYNYRILAPYAPKANEVVAFGSFTKLSKKSWDSTKQGIKGFKKNIRVYLESKQKERCAYCRQYLQSSGKGEHLDHVVAKDSRPQWMFTAINLVLCCAGCNTPKNSSLVLKWPASIRTANYPDNQAAFKIFNPYFEEWADHFFVDDQVFIRARPNSKGDFTIETCQLFREQVIINNMRELRMSKMKSRRKITQLLYTCVPGTPEYIRLEGVIDQIVRTS